MVLLTHIHKRQLQITGAEETTPSAVLQSSSRVQLLPLLPDA